MERILPISLFYFLLSVACSKGTSRGSDLTSPAKEEVGLFSETDTEVATDVSIAEMKVQQASSVKPNVTASLSQQAVGVFTTTAATATTKTAAKTAANVNLLTLVDTAVPEMLTLTQTPVAAPFDFTKPFYLRTPTCGVIAANNNGTITTRFHCEEGLPTAASFHVDTANGFISVQNPANSVQFWRMYYSSSTTTPLYGYNLPTSPAGYNSVLVYLTNFAIGSIFSFGSVGCSPNCQRLTFAALPFMSDQPAVFTYTAFDVAATGAAMPLAATSVAVDANDPSQIMITLPFCYLALTSSSLLDCSGNINNATTFTYFQNSVDQKFYLKSNGFYFAADGSITAVSSPATLVAPPASVSALPEARYIQFSTGKYLIPGSWESSSTTIPTAAGSTGMLLIGEAP